MDHTNETAMRDLLARVTFNTGIALAEDTPVMLRAEDMNAILNYIIGLTVQVNDQAAAIQHLQAQFKTARTLAIKQAGMAESEV